MCLRFFPGFLDLLKDYRRAGGRVAVISHSEAGVIEGHYRAAAGGLGAAAADPPFLPDLIFGWEADANHRKPSPWPVGEALRLFGLPAKEALVVDDLKPGVLMAHAAGVDFAAAGWSHRVERDRTLHARAGGGVLRRDPGPAGAPPGAVISSAFKRLTGSRSGAPPGARVPGPLAGALSVRRRATILLERSQEG